eukprot:TRINITY_DN26628_c0_g2_i2.p1 TRINITY_DN26628_c0_g2~~TRINITY_DN26628_c0_g2_i2.p1  ORF type:complete len:122 (-),score=44.38 TRINITY_DN26628_c0_g2_i2:31-396(-)
MCIRDRPNVSQARDDVVKAEITVKIIDDINCMDAFAYINRADAEKTIYLNPFLLHQFGLTLNILGEESSNALKVQQTFLGIKLMHEISHLIHTEFRLKKDCLLYTSPSPRDRTRSRMPSSA